MIKVKITDFVVAAALCVIIVLASVLCAQRLVSSQMYRQSKIVSMLVRQESLDVGDLLVDSRGIRMVVRFAGALTAAYINFELIPFNEASAFMAIFESMPDSVVVDNFEYRRKDLAVIGEAASEAGLYDFVDRLKDTKIYESVTSSYYEAVNGKIRFEIICVSRPVDTIMDFA